MPRPALLLVVLAFASLAVGACRERAANAQQQKPAPAALLGDPARGEVLVAELECSRCHSGTGTTDAPADKSCAGCHRAIHSGEFSANVFTLIGWRARIRHFLLVPSLAGSSERLRRSWVERYLRNPVDLRPGLDESMPLLELDAEQARDISAYLAPEEAQTPFEPNGDLDRGRALLESKGCATCHRYGGVPPLRASALPVPLDDERLRRALALAPDLRWARARLLPEYLRRWLEKPSAVRRDALMPDIPLSELEILDIVTYLVRAPLTEPASSPRSRLPLLSRPVLWQEVSQRVFRDTCWHCHSDPDYARGDGGPGNTGGFGFRGKGIDLAEHEGLLAGFVDATGERRSLLEPDATSGESRLVASLWARHAEERGERVAGVRGMPLGLPALSPEDIQLVESWIAQGRSR